jgi:hypothetical protein
MIKQAKIQNSARLLWARIENLSQYRKKSALCQKETSHSVRRNCPLKKFSKPLSFFSKHLNKRHKCSRIDLIVTKLQKPIMCPGKLRVGSVCLNVGHGEP